MSKRPTSLHFRQWEKGEKGNCENVKGIAGVQRGYTNKKKGTRERGQGGFQVIRSFSNTTEISPTNKLWTVHKNWQILILLPQHIRVKVLAGIS